MSHPVEWNGKVWMHGASLGECLMLVEVAKRIMNPVVLTTHRAKNAEALQKQLANNPSIQVQVAPPLWKRTLQRYMDKQHPQMLVLAESELWPAWLEWCEENNIPVHIISGRMSAQALQRWQWLPKRWVQKWQNPIQSIWAQSPEDALRWMQWGFQGQLQAAGDWKWLAPVQITPETSAQWENRKLDLLLLSIRKEEWVKVKDGLEKLHEFESRVALIPRYAEHAAWFKKQLSLLAPSVQVISEYGQSKHWISQSKLVMIGGGLRGRQTHNFREALQQGVPVIVGPRVGNYAREVEILRQRGVLAQLADLADLNIGRNGRDCFLLKFYPWEMRNLIPAVLEEFRHPLECALRQWIYEAGLVER